jgi:hypothetical protein
MSDGSIACTRRSQRRRPVSQAANQSRVQMMRSAQLLRRKSATTHRSQAVRLPACRRAGQRMCAPWGVVPRTWAYLTCKNLTVKLRGRPEAPDWSRGCTLSFGTRGDTTEHHGPLQRLLDGRSSRVRAPHKVPDAPPHLHEPWWPWRNRETTFGQQCLSCF